jgi:hypothetical protein
MKAFYESKLFWVGAITTLLGVLQLFSEWYAKADFSVPGIISLVIGILVIVLRVWFTDTPIDTPKMRRDWAGSFGAEIIEDEPTEDGR